MAHPSVDLVEEDAADLQFPKAKSAFFPDYTTPRKGILCNYCLESLSEPFIECLECREMFCLSCFSSGMESKSHRNFHSYTVRRDDFPIFTTSSWTGREEKVLLDLVAKFGLGNWTDVAKFMENRSSSECRSHYFQFYVKGFVGRMSGLDVEPYERQDCPYMARRECSRIFRFPTESLNAKTLAGYRAARGEFDIPYDQTAESLISQLDIEPWASEEDTEATRELNCTVFRTFNNRMRERQRRYRIIREHGLLDHQSTASQLRNIEEILSVGEKSVEKAANAMRFSAFMQLLSAESFHLLLVRLKYCQDLRSYLYRLYQLRRVGVTSIHGGKLYYKLLETRKRRSLAEKCRREALEVPMNVPTTQAKRMNPIDIVGLPGYERLSEEEKIICSSLRLEPNAFFSHRETLVSANAKHGHLPLAEARKLLKIDVNKTRKLYDFLLSRGLVAKPQT